MHLPLYHNGVHVGNAITDRNLAELPFRKWSLRIPESIRRVYQEHTLTAILREDPTILSKCSPVIDLRASRKYEAKLARIVLRPDTIPLLQQYVHTIHPLRKEALLWEISSRLGEVGRVVHCNRNRVDCRLENLREIKGESDAIWNESGVREEQDDEDPGTGGDCRVPHL